MSPQGQAGLPGAPGFPGLRGEKGQQVGVGVSAPRPLSCAIAVGSAPLGLGPWGVGVIGLGVGFPGSGEGRARPLLGAGTGQWRAVSLEGGRVGGRCPSGPLQSGAPHSPLAARPGFPCGYRGRGCGGCGGEVSPGPLVVPGAGHAAAELTFLTVSLPQGEKGGLGLPGQKGDRGDKVGAGAPVSGTTLGTSPLCA